MAKERGNEKPRWRGWGECSPSLKQEERYVGRGQVLHLQERRKRSFRSWDSKEVIKGVSVLSFPGGASGKEPACQCRRCKKHGFDPWAGKIPRRRAWQPTPVFFAWRIPWTEEPGGLQSLGSHKVLNDCNNFKNARTHAHRVS